jgi:signal peptidase II
MKRSTLISLLIFMTALFIDQFSKQWAKDLPSLRYNPGFILGFYSDLPDTLRIISLASFAGFIFFFYICYLTLSPKRAGVLNYAISLLVAGILGNAIDKSLLGMTVDFIPFQLFEIIMHFNLADVFLWVGACAILWVIFHKDKILWYPESTRQRYLVRPKDQIKVASLFALLSFSSCVVLGIFSFAYFNTILTNINLSGNLDHLMMNFFVTYCFLSLLFCSLSFIAGIFISHKSVGPIYAFELFVNDLISGSKRKFKLRDGDSHKDLEVVAERLRQHLKTDE